VLRLCVANAPTLSLASAAYVPTATFTISATPALPRYCYTTSGAAALCTGGAGNCGASGVAYSGAVTVTAATYEAWGCDANQAATTKSAQYTYTIGMCSMLLSLRVASAARRG
jgi:hypothetical protein